MNLLGRLFNRVLRYRQGLYRRVYRARVILQSKLLDRKVFWPRSVNAAVPVRVDGLGEVLLGEAVSLGYLPAPLVGSGEILLQARSGGSCIEIGARTAASNNVSIIAMRSVRLGESCQIGDGVLIFDCDFHEVNPATRSRSSGCVSPVAIGNNVWLGSRVIVLKGVTIGDNTVVAAGSVVAKSLPANVLAAGVPAKVVRLI